VKPLICMLVIVWAGFVTALMTYQEDPPPVPYEVPAHAPPIEECTPVPAFGMTVPVKVLSVRDGDTLKVRVQFECDVRLLDCWAPEVTGPEKLEGFKSRDSLMRMALGKTGVLYVPLSHENIGRATSMGRVLGHVYVDGQDLSAEQVKKGFAKPEKSGTP
jgi:endonuclease YncB( thermonuclease family)